MQRPVYCRDSAGVAHAIATVSWGDDLKVTVNVTYNESSAWRIKPQGTNTTPVLTVTGGGTTGSFVADYGTTYVFQSVIRNNWTNSLDGSGNFTVDDGSSGGDSGDSGGDTGGSTGGGTGGSGSSTEYYLYLKADAEGVDISVTRTFAGSADVGDYLGELVNGNLVQNEYGHWREYRIWSYDRFKISVKAQDGYIVESKQIYGLTYDASLSEYVFYASRADLAYVWPVASVISEAPTGEELFVIGNGSMSAKFRAFTFHNGEWVPGISLSNNIKTYTGTFTLKDYVADVECGFVPDIVIIDAGAYTGWFGDATLYVNNTAALPIYKDGSITRAQCMTPDTNRMMLFLGFHKAEMTTGFSVFGSIRDYSNREYELTGEISYTAIKYT